MAKPKPDIQAAFKYLRTVYPSSDTELKYDGEFQLLVAVILSAQCTDARVNLTTPALFAKFPTPEKLASAPPAEVEKLIHSCGFYRQKAKSIQSAAKDIVEKFASQVPRTMEELVSLRGVGRKTASVVLSQAFKVPAIAVDTHVSRVSQRLGWARATDPVKIEQELMKLIPKDLWNFVNGLLILHGRRLCGARKPKCEECELRAQCKFYITSRKRT